MTHAVLELYAAAADPFVPLWWHAYGGLAGRQWVRVFTGPTVAGPDTPGVTDPLPFAEMEDQRVSDWIWVTNGPLEIPPRLGPRPELKAAALPYLRSWLGAVALDMDAETQEFLPDDVFDGVQVSYTMRVHPEA